MTTLAILSDLHVGSIAGLWPGRHEIEGGGVYEANLAQQWLYRCWQDCIAEVQGLERPVVIINGDAIQGINARDGQLIGSSVAAQVSAATSLLTPIAEAAGRLYVVRGTEWHDGKAAEHLELLAGQLCAQEDPATKQRSWWELYLDVGGAVMHFAHHVGTSSVPWYEATVPLRDTLMQIAELQRFYAAAAPNVRLVVRSHRHRLIHVQAPPDLQVVVTPGWQLKTAFAHKKATSMLPQVGWVRVDVAEGEIIVRPRIYSLPPLHMEVLDGA